MKTSMLTTILSLAWAVLPSIANSEPVQLQIKHEEKVYIKGGDQYVSGIVSGIVLTLTRDVTTENKEVTYWKIEYNYYNGAQRWESLQQLTLDFVDNLGVTLVNHAVVVNTPSGKCHYGKGIDVAQTGIMPFDFRGHELAIRASGSTPVPGFRNRDHKC